MWKFKKALVFYICCGLMYSLYLTKQYFFYFWEQGLEIGISTVLVAGDLT